MKRLNCLSIGIATVLPIVAGSASAAHVNRVFSTWAPGICQAALPAFEGQIRKRPMAIQNEGTGNAFVTCAFTLQDTWTTAIAIKAQNLGATAQDISCTGVFRDDDNSITWYAVKMATLAPGEVSQLQLQWTSSDFGGGDSPRRCQVNCSVPHAICGQASASPRATSISAKTWVLDRSREPQMPRRPSRSSFHPATVWRVSASS